MSKLYIVGIGPGAPDYLTYKAVEIIKSADVLLGSKRTLELFADSHGEKLELDTRDMGSSFKEAIFLAGNGKTVALLSTGDPGFSGLLKPILNISDVDVEVIPGISSIQLCAAKLGISWDEANLITLHGKENANDLLLNILKNDKITILLPKFNVKETADYLLKQGFDPDREVAVCERLGYPEEKVVKMKLKDLRKHDFSYMCVMVIY